MALLLAPVLLIVGVLYIAYPLLKEAEETEVWATDEGSAKAKIDQEKSDIINVLRDIDMDYRTGKLTQQDYEALKADYEHRAVGVFQQLEELQKRGGQDRKKNS
ncbi:MAG: hypothetical protein V3R94_01510 [Acidobacteriota bacterium]